MIDPPASTQPFAPHERTLPATLTRQAERFGERPLVTAGAHTLSFRTACDTAARFAAALHAAGIRPGDQVALIASNRLEFVEVFLGCAWLGAVSVPINTASRGAQLQHILANCRARLLIIEQTFLPNLDHLDHAALALEAIWLIGTGTTVGVGPLTATPLPHRNGSIEPTMLRPSDLLTILYTSGTTGPSKGVCCPHAQYYWWGMNTSALLGVRADDVLATTLPLFHTNALNTFYQALLTGAAVVYELRFSASAFYAALAACKATVTYLLGAMVPILLSRPAAEEERTHHVRVALAPGVPAQFHAPFTARTGIRLLEGWGSTETNFVLGAPADRQRPGTMGPVYRGFDARVVDEEDNEIVDDTPGELIVRADEPFAFAAGYFDEPQKTVKAWRNLWFHTGDRVIREPDGYFRFVDRLKDAIRRRGENISAFEVEQVLLSHPAVANAAVFPVRSALAEDEVMATIILRPGEMLAARDLVAFCEPRLPYFAVPRYVDFASELPTTENGKVQKYKLTARGITASTWDREASGYRIKRT